MGPMIASGLRWTLYLAASVLALVAVFFLTIAGVVVNHDMSGLSNPHVGNPHLDISLVRRAQP
jgi:hypothetical protein